LNKVQKVLLQSYFYLQSTINDVTNLCYNQNNISDELILFIIVMNKQSKLQLICKKKFLEKNCRHLQMYALASGLTLINLI